MPLQPDEAEIRQRVTRRYRTRLRFAIHVFLTLPVMVICGLIGSKSGPDAEKVYAAAGLFMVWICSLFIHFASLIFAELTERAIQREIDRQWQLANFPYDKPKRGVTRLSAISDDGELAVLEEDGQNHAGARR